MLKYDIVAICRIVDKVLSDYEKPYHPDSLDPSVDIRGMADKLGLKVEFVLHNQDFPFFNEATGRVGEWSLGGKHAYVTQDGTIAINVKYSSNEARSRFNIAYGIALILLGLAKVSLPTVKSYLESVNPALASRDKRSLFGKRVREEDAVHLAANLLVPPDRFQSWETKPDDVIASAFKVEIKCIQKRRNEVANELKDLAAAVKR